jgi:tRNA A-37 threonylcarbamoyl transferase component Bud32
MEMTKRCGGCGHPLSPTARFCPNCGLKQGDLRPRDGTGLLPANRRLHGDRFVIVHKVAQGGQSAVYLAMDTASGERCAIKEMSESQLTESERKQALNDFLREGTLLRGLKHPGLCRVIDTFIEEDSKAFLAMEFIEGHNLEDELIETGRPLDWPRVTQWGVMLAEVLAYLHGQTPPVIYRDLKPANVMLLPNGAIKLIDFGIARELHSNRKQDTARLGTDGYAPLEQYSARSEPRSDLYALGASLYHLLTGRVPEAAPLRAAGHSMTPIRAFNPSVPEELERVIQQAMNKLPDERFPNAQTMRQALEWAGHAGSQRSGPMRAQMSRATFPISGRMAGGVPSGPARGAGSHLNGRNGANGAYGPNGQAQGPAPKLRVWPLRLDVGLLDANQTATQALEFGNRGGGELLGTTETNSDCLVATPPQLDGATTQIQVQINTAGLLPGEYICHLAVRTNGGDQIVPVRFMVRPANEAPAGGWTQPR